MVDTRAISVVIDATEDILFTVDVATPCGLIINELLSNVLKHAFPPGFADRCGRQPEIRISLHPADNDRYTLVISDNGIGLPADRDQEQTTSLGMQIVEVLTKQLKAELEVGGQQGTTVKITFPGSLRPRNRNPELPL